MALLRPGQNIDIGRPLQDFPAFELRHAADDPDDKTFPPVFIPLQFSQARVDFLNSLIPNAAGIQDYDIGFGGASCSLQSVDC
jgi:hypothetical protein